MSERSHRAEPRPERSKPGCYLAHGRDSAPDALQVVVLPVGIFVEFRFRHKLDPVVEFGERKFDADLGERQGCIETRIDLAGRAGSDRRNSTTVAESCSTKA